MRNDAENPKIIDIEIEQIILGMILEEDNKEWVDLIDSMMDIDPFYLTGHKIIWKYIKDSISNGEPIEVMAIARKLKENPSDLNKVEQGLAYLYDLLCYSTSSEDEVFRHYAEKFYYTAFSRWTKKQLQKAIQMIYDENMANVINRLGSIIEGWEKSAQADFSDVPEKIKKVLGEILKPESINDESFIQSGIVEGDNLDWICRGKLTTIAGMPGSGKSSIGRTLMWNMMKRKKGIYISLEMPIESLSQCFVALATEVPINKIRQIYKTKDNQCLEDWEYNEVKKLMGKDIDMGWIYKEHPFSLSTLKRVLRAKPDLDFIVLDYYQLMDDDQGGFVNKTTADERLAYGLLDLAQRFNVAMVVLSQVNKVSESRDPLLEDLPYTGLSRASQFVGIIKGTGFTEVGGISKVDELVEIHVVKNRFGTRKVFPLNFLKYCGKFVDTTDEGWETFWKIRRKELKVGEIIEATNNE